MPGGDIVSAEKNGVFERFNQKFQMLLPVELLDRRHFLACAQREFSRARLHAAPLTLLSLDIDNLTDINKTYGKRMGDKAVALVVKICKSALVKGELLGRSGDGDEFWVASSRDQNRGHGLAEQIRQSVEKKALTDEALATVSLGLAWLRPDVRDLGTLLRQAEVSLARAKAEGKNRVSITPCGC
jgi:diguanylate cyclase (GGDEF)-like protein